MAPMCNAELSLAAPVAIQPEPAIPASRRIPGHRGMWVGIACELVEFGLLFCVYFIARVHFPDAFHAGPGHLNQTLGTLITLLMVTSSYFIASSVAAIRAGQRRRSILWLAAGLVVALGYPITKYLEIRWNLAHGVDSSAGVFVIVYYYLTINHLVHASWGILGMIWVLGRHLAGAYGTEEHNGLESLGSYWHATDIIWLVLFPLFYVWG